MILNDSKPTQFTSAQIPLQPGERSEPRYISVVTDGGGLKTVELTPLLEVRVIDAEPRVEIGHYLQILAITHDPPLRHLT